MTLSEYIDLIGGDSTAAQLFGVRPRTVASWRRGERLPRPERAYHIVEVTGGRVDLDGIYATAKETSRAAN